MSQIYLELVNILKNQSLTFQGVTVEHRTYHECEGSIEKSVPRDHHLASPGLPSDDK